MELIHSENNGRLKQVRNLLAYSKRRNKEQRFVLEGIRLLQDALQTEVKADYVLFDDDALQHNKALKELKTTLEAREIPLYAVEKVLFNNLSATEHSQGVVGIFPLPEIEFPEEIKTVIVLDRIADPGNLGTIIRSSVAAGADAVITTPGSVDIFNPKVVRSAMGGHFKIPVYQWEWADILEFELPIILAEAKAEKTIYEMDFSEPCIVAIGAEAHGFSLASRAYADAMVTIPMAQGESLNAAMASTVILYEILRQRLSQ